VGDSQAAYYTRMYGAWLPTLKQTGHAPIGPRAKAPHSKTDRSAEKS